MPKKQPYSGKQKKKQLQERKQRKQDGPKYLADQSDSDENDQPADIATESVKSSSVALGATASDGAFGKAEMKNLIVQKLNQQPSASLKSKSDKSNSYRLHFFKETDEVISRKKKDAKKPVKPVDEIHLEYKIEEVYPADASLDFPKRPPWNYHLTKQKLEEQEKKYFDNYLQEILGQPRGCDLSYLELNLQTWRQLWRVTEISDVLAVIADVRYPVLHVPPSLVKHVTEELRKPLIIILNKVDFVPVPIAVAWKRYFCQKFPGIHVIFFTSFPRDVYREEELMDFTHVKKLYKVPHQGRMFPLGPAQLWSACKDIVKDTVDLSSWEEMVHSSTSGTKWEKEQELEDFPTSNPDISQNNRGAASNKEDLEDDIFPAAQSSFKNGVLTLGFIGYPNAGKSSVLNAILNRKAVSVSQTPGHTKHLQTIFLSPTVKLCDCPGLVFPSVVPKSLQVVAGIFPVAQVREPYSVVAYLGRRLDLPVLLGLTPPYTSPKKTDKATDIWSAMDICEAWAIKSGFRTSKAGRPDVYRAANQILRLAVTGQLCLSFRPPKYSKSDENIQDPDIAHLVELLSSHAKSRQQMYSHSDSDVHDEESEEEFDEEIDREGEMRFGADEIRELLEEMDQS